MVQQLCLQLSEDILSVAQTTLLSLYPALFSLAVQQLKLLLKFVKLPLIPSFNQHFHHLLLADWCITAVTFLTRGAASHYLTFPQSLIYGH